MDISWSFLQTAVYRINIWNVLLIHLSSPNFVMPFVPGVGISPSSRKVRLIRIYRYHYTTVCYDFDNLLHSADCKLFTSVRKSHHCLHSLLPPIKESGHYLREIVHPIWITHLLLHFYSGHFSNKFFAQFSLVIGFYVATFIGFLSAVLILKCSVFYQLCQLYLFHLYCVSTFSVYVCYIPQ